MKKIALLLAFILSLAFTASAQTAPASPIEGQQALLPLFGQLTSGQLMLVGAVHDLKKVVPAKLETAAQQVAVKRQAGPEAARAKEDRLLSLINEFRTRGTVDGKEAVRGTCAEGRNVVGTLAPVQRALVLDVPARLHAQYMGEVEYAGFNQTVTTSPLYTGQGPAERRALAEQVLGERFGAGTFQLNVKKADPAAALVEWLRQPKQCEVIIGQWDSIGVGYDAGDPNGTGFDITGTRPVMRDTWMINWAKSPVMASR